MRRFQATSNSFTFSENLLLSVFIRDLVGFSKSNVCTGFDETFLLCLEAWIGYKPLWNALGGNRRGRGEGVGRAVVGLGLNLLMLLIN